METAKQRLRGLDAQSLGNQLLIQLLEITKAKNAIARQPLIYLFFSSCCKLVAILFLL